MKILLCGANGYIGLKLLPLLTGQNHQVVCLVRNAQKFRRECAPSPLVEILEGDLLREKSVSLPSDLDAVYYLVNSMPSFRGFHHLHLLSARNLVHALKNTSCQQIIYLTGIINEQSFNRFTPQQHIEDILKESGIHYTILRASGIIGEGSAFFDILRDMVEKLKVIVSSNWINYKCQPIALADVLYYLKQTLLLQASFNRTFDIGGPEILSYKDMMSEYARIRQMKRWFLTFPIQNTEVAAYWLKTITSVPYGVARDLLDRMRSSMICKDNAIQEIMPRSSLSYRQSLEAILQSPPTHSLSYS